MRGGDLKAEIPWTPTVSIASASLSGTRASSAVGAKSKVPQLAIAVGAISVAVMTAAVIKSGYGASDTTGDAVNSSFDTTAASLGSSIEVHSSTSQDVPVFGQVEPVPKASSSNKHQPPPSLSSGAAPVASSASARVAGARSARGIEEEESLSGSAPITSATKGPETAPFALGEASQRIAAAGVDLAPVHKSVHEETRGSEEQSVSWLSGPVSVSAMPSESDFLISEVASHFSLGSANEASPPVVAEAVGGRLATKSPPALENVVAPSSASADIRNLTEGGTLAAEHVVGAFPVEQAGSLDEVLLPDVELVDGAAIGISASVGDSAVVAAESVQPAANVKIANLPASFDVAPSAIEGGFGIPSDELTRSQLAPNTATVALHDPTSPAADAVRPVEKVSVTVQRPSTEGLEASFAESTPRPDMESSLKGGVENLTAVVRTDPATFGDLPLHISSDALVSVRLADLISLFEDRMERPLFVWLKSSANANEYVTFDTLRSAGIAVHYDAEAQQVALSIADVTVP